MKEEKDSRIEVAIYISLLYSTYLVVYLIYNYSYNYIMALRFLDVVLTVFTVIDIRAEHIYDTGYASSSAPLLGVFHNTLINAHPKLARCVN